MNIIFLNSVIFIQKRPKYDEIFFDFSDLPPPTIKSSRDSRQPPNRFSLVSTVHAFRTSDGFYSPPLSSTVSIRRPELNSNYLIEELFVTFLCLLPFYCFLSVSFQSIIVFLVFNTVEMFVLSVFFVRTKLVPTRPHEHSYSGDRRCICFRWFPQLIANGGHDAIALYC